MANRSLRDLNYGYPGAANYDLDTGDWLFGRQYTARRLVQVRSLKGIHPATTVTIPPSAQLPLPQTSSSSAGLQTDIKSYIQQNTQITPASEILPELAIVSAAISSTTSIYDPLVGSLLSFGSFTREDKYDDPRQLAAFPSGEGGNILRLAMVNRERHSWRADRTVWVDGPTLKDAECGYWNEEAAPIQQVCFAQSEDRSSLLAVRLPTRTVLFRPVCHRQARAAGRSPFYHLPASTIDAHPILSLHLDETAGFPHTDVAFNPDSQLQLALVDQNQTWSVWDIEHPRKGDTYSISCLVRGEIQETQQEDEPEEDGWSRILWVADSSTLLVCNRRHLSIIGINGKSSTYLPCPLMFSERYADWILDVKRHPKHRGRVFVLTSSRLVLIRVTASSEASDASAEEAGAVILASWRHYRGADDFSLQMSVQMVSDDESCLMLHSCLNNLVQIYTFSEYSGSSELVSSSDPSALQLEMNGSGRITKICMERMHYGSLGKGTFGPGRSYMQRDIKFFRLFVTRSDLSVHELVVCTQDHRGSRANGDAQAVEDFTRNFVRHLRRDNSKADVIEQEDEFILPDGLTVVEAPRPKVVSQVELWSQDDPVLDNTRDNGFLAEVVVRMDNDGTGTSKAADTRLVTSQVKQMLVGDSNPALPVGTLMDIANMQLDVLDIDEASSNFQELFSLEDRQDLVDLERIAPADVLELTENMDPTMSDVYDSMLETWVAPLPPEVPSRVRQQKERLVRQVAAELMLGSTRILYHPLQEPAIESQRGPSQDSAVTLPILPSKPREGTVDSQIHFSSPQPLPTPPFSSIPSSSFPTSSPLVSPPAPTTQPNPMTRLRKYLRFREDTVTPAIIVPNVSQVLAHFQPGSDPRTYDWVATERALQPEELDEESQQQREKERRRKERRERRQQRENELLRIKAASQPTLLPRSSPGPMMGGMGSSSQVPSQIPAHSQLPLSHGVFRGAEGRDILGPQSQVEPGKFGGRPDSKTKKKGRVSGF